MKKLFSIITMIALTLAMFMQPLAAPSKANTNSNSPVSAPAEEPAPVAPSAPAMAYPLAKIRNRTIFPATGTVRYVSHLCRDDRFSVPAGVLQQDGSIKEGFWQARRRGSCLIKRIDAQLNGAGRRVTSYTSSGTSYGNFIIQGTQTDFRVWSDHELARENSNSREGKSPGFYITNKDYLAYLNRVESSRMSVLSNDTARRGI